MTFRSVFIAVFLGTALLASALLIHRARPAEELDQPGAAWVRATGKCAECHERETSAVVRQYEAGAHVRGGVTCYDCHRPVAGQEGKDHNGFLLSASVTSANCRQCHATEYEQFARSRHAAPAWGAVVGTQGFTPEQVAWAESIHPGTVDRPPNAVAVAEGEGVLDKGCLGCHAVGRPNADGSIGTCTHCHGIHRASVAMARRPETCGQCHMGPDHSQVEIYFESKHGALFKAQEADMNLGAAPKTLTTRDMPVPTCATCHMSGLEGAKVTHDTTERLGWFLFAPVSERRPAHARATTEMQETCLKCHAKGRVEQFYAQAVEVVEATNAKVKAALDVVKALRQEGLLTPEPFDEPLEFLEFDLWHYYGRTAKHGAFMGGADFVQWHGNYELLAKAVEIREIAERLRAEHEKR